MKTLITLTSFTFVALAFTVGCKIDDDQLTAKPTCATDKIWDETKKECVDKTKESQTDPKTLPRQGTVVQVYTITSQMHTDMKISSGDTESILRDEGQCVKVTSIQFVTLKIKVNVLPSDRSSRYREETCGSKDNICQPSNYNIIYNSSTGPQLEKATSANTSEECKNLGASFPKSST